MGSGPRRQQSRACVNNEKPYWRVAKLKPPQLDAALAEELAFSTSDIDRQRLHLSTESGHRLCHVWSIRRLALSGSRPGHIMRTANMSRGRSDNIYSSL